MPRHPLLWLALVCHLFLATSYLQRTPSFEGPDENAHYQYAWHLANSRHLPIAPGYAEAHNRVALDQVVLAHHPPLYYALLAVGIEAMGATDTVFSTVPNPQFGLTSHLAWLHGGDEVPPRAVDENVLWTLRGFSVLLGLLSLVAIYRLGLVCCPDRPAVAGVATLLVACLPMWSFLHAVLNNDNLATLLCTATLVVLVRVAKSRDLLLTQAVLLGALLGLAMLTKVTTWFLWPLALVVVVRAVREQREALAPAIVALLVALLICDPILLRNWSLYGDPLALRAHDAAFANIPPDLRWPWLWGGFLPQVFSSLMGRFGWFSLQPPTPLVIGGATVTGLGIAGLIAHRVGKQRAPLPQPFALLFAACALVFVATAWFNWASPQPQGRLLFPAIGPAAVLLAAGLVHLGSLLRLPAAVNWLCLAPPAVAIWVLFGWFAPEFTLAGATSPPHHAALVGGILEKVEQPGIEWLSPADVQTVAPPTLRWRDPTASPHEIYSLYAYDDHGRVWLASYEWHFELTGDSATIPADAWAFLPTDRDVYLKLRCVPDWSAGERRESMPTSAPLRIRRLPH